METDYPFHREPEHSINQCNALLRVCPFILLSSRRCSSVTRCSDLGMTPLQGDRGEQEARARRMVPSRALRQNERGERRGAPQAATDHGRAQGERLKSLLSRSSNDFRWLAKAPDGSCSYKHTLFVASNGS